MAVTKPARKLRMGDRLIFGSYRDKLIEWEHINPSGCGSEFIARQCFGSMPIAKPPDDTLAKSGMFRFFNSEDLDVPMQGHNGGFLAEFTPTELRSLLPWPDMTTADDKPVLMRLPYVHEVFGMRRLSYFDRHAVRTKDPRAPGVYRLTVLMPEPDEPTAVYKVSGDGTYAQFAYWASSGYGRPVCRLDPETPLIEVDGVYRCSEGTVTSDDILGLFGSLL